MIERSNAGRVENHGDRENSNRTRFHSEMAQQSARIVATDVRGGDDGDGSDGSSDGDGTDTDAGDGSSGDGSGMGATATPNGGAYCE